MFNKFHIVHNSINYLLFASKKMHFKSPVIEKFSFYYQSLQYQYPICRNIIRFPRSSLSERKNQFLLFLYFFVFSNCYSKNVKAFLSLWNWNRNLSHQTSKSHPSQLKYLRCQNKHFQIVESKAVTSSTNIVFNW